MSLVVLIRHAHSTANEAGLLSGQRSGVHLSEKGRKQARELTHRLGGLPLKTLRSSPLERCRETIEPWRKKFAPEVEVEIEDDLLEIDYGNWSGRKLRTLVKEPLWSIVQNQPSRVIFPGGEAMAAMQTRALGALYRALDAPGKGHILLISHGDVLKSIVASAMGMHLDEFQRIVLDPASISLLDFSAGKGRVLLMNGSPSKISEILATTHSKRLLVGGGSGITSKKKSS